MKNWIVIASILNLTEIYLGAQDPYLQGIAKLEEGDYLKAVEIFSLTLESGRSNPELYS